MIMQIFVKNIKLELMLASRSKFWKWHIRFLLFPFKWNPFPANIGI